MSDSDSDSFHSACDEDFDREESVDNVEHVEKIVKNVENKEERVEKIFPEKSKVVIEENLRDERIKIPNELKKKDILANDSNEVKDVAEKDEGSPDSSPVDEVKDTDGWDDWGDDSASSSEDADWESWDKDVKDEKKVKHRTKHSKIKVEDIPSDSTEADEEVHREKKKSHGKEPSLWDWSGLNEVVSAVGDKISNVVETRLGLPAPEEMAKLSMAERRKMLEEAQNAKEPEPSLSSDEATEPQSPSPEEQQIGSGFSGLFSGIMNGGLDVLETLGKKTFETLTVKDESNSEKRKFFLNTVDSSSSSLSDMLKEVKTLEREGSSPSSPLKHRFGYGSTNAENPRTNFIIQFEKNEGMVHLEGLELLHTSKKQRIFSDKNEEFDDRIAEFVVEDVSECTTDDFIYEIKKCLQNINLPYKADNVLKADDELRKVLLKTQEELDAGIDFSTEKMHENAIQSLSKLTAHSIQALHKIAQLMVMANEMSDLDHLFAFTFVLCRRLSFYASQYANLLSLLDSTCVVDNVVTNIFFECSNACHYVKKGLSYLKPFFCE